MAYGGMASAAGWGRGQLFGPIIERHDPVTAHAVEAELVVAADELYQVLAADEPERVAVVSPSLRHVARGTGRLCRPDE
jgi:hypothetical protein